MRSNSSAAAPPVHPAADRRQLLLTPVRIALRLVRRPLMLQTGRAPPAHAGPASAMPQCAYGARDSSRIVGGRDRQYPGLARWPIESSAWGFTGGRREEGLRHEEGPSDHPVL